jgi:hypothetical protein
MIVQGRLVKEEKKGKRMQAEMPKAGGGGGVQVTRWGNCCGLAVPNLDFASRSSTMT